MKKKLDVTSITNELEGGSAFFPSYKKPAVGFEEGKTETSTPPSPKPKPKAKAKKKEITPSDTMIPSNHDTTIPRYRDTKVSRYQDTTVPTLPNEYDEDIIEIIRKGVKQIGKEPATQRLTVKEKQDLKEIEFHYLKEGIRTNANEIIRIATNYIVHDYKNNGENSILNKVIKKLNS
jgi:hypothetical protein